MGHARWIALLAGTLAFSLTGCDDGSSSSPVAPVASDTAKVDTTSKAPVGWGTELVGSWSADTTITVGAGFLSVPAGVKMTVTFGDDHSFGSNLDATFMNQPIQGHLFTEAGTWAQRSPDTVVIRPLTCQTSDTAVDTGAGALPLPIALPFHSDAKVGYVANTLKSSKCPDSTLLTSRPVGGAIRMAVPFKLPGQKDSALSVTFKKK